jgi:ABC-type nitrate/sulfonate/bicarbonate transport system substrate-binding protein
LRSSCGTFGALTLLALLCASLPAPAADTLRLAIGSRGVWENSNAELGQAAGIYARHGLKLEILYTQGGGETMQAVISGSADIGIGVGTYGVIGAFAKGAPVRVLGASITGATDQYWYVLADSSIQTIKDAAGKTVAYSTNGSSTQAAVLGFQRLHGVQFRTVATGSAAATFTMVMTRQIEVGWASPPFGIEALEAGRIRIVAKAGEVPSLRDQSPRLVVANADALARRTDAFARYMRAYRETIGWMYADPSAIGAYARLADIPLAIARRVRDEFFPREKLDPDHVSGLTEAMADAIAFKYIAAPLTEQQLGELIRIPPR